MVDVVVKVEVVAGADVEEHNLLWRWRLWWGKGCGLQLMVAMDVVEVLLKVVEVLVEVEVKVKVVMEVEA